MSDSAKSGVIRVEPLVIKNNETRRLIYLIFGFLFEKGLEEKERVGKSWKGRGRSDRIGSDRIGSGG